MPAERDRSDYAMRFLERLKYQAAGAGGPSPLGLHILMSEGAPTTVRNTIDNIAWGTIAPVELVATKPSEDRG